MISLMHFEVSLILNRPAEIHQLNNTLQTAADLLSMAKVPTTHSAPVRRAELAAASSVLGHHPTSAKVTRQYIGHVRSDVWQHRLKEPMIDDFAPA